MVAAATMMSTGLLSRRSGGGPLLPKKDEEDPRKKRVLTPAERNGIPVPLLCRGIFGIRKHSWIYLLPTAEQLDEIREIASQGRESQGAMAGARAQEVYNRVCPKCYTAENRLPLFLAALREARGGEE